MYKHILECANIKSTTTDKETVDKIIDKSLLEHGTVYLYIEDNQQLEEDCGPEEGFTDMDVFKYIRSFFVKNPFSNCMYRHQEGICDRLYITTNYRVIIDNDLKFLMKYWCEPNIDFECRYTIKWNIDYPTYISILRHRLLTTTANNSFKSVLQHYDTDKKDMNLTFVIPDCMDLVTTGEAKASDIIKLCNDKLKDDKLISDEKQYFIYLKNCAYTEIGFNDMFKSNGDDYNTIKYIYNAPLCVTIYTTGFRYDCANVLKYEMNNANENKRLFNSVYEIIDNLNTLHNEDRNRSDNDSTKKN